SGQSCNWLSYASHVLVFTHSVLKTLQVINRFTALYFPGRYQHALYIEISDGKLKYAGIEKSAQEIAKILSTTILALFVIVTLPINMMLIYRMHGLRKKDISLFNKERTYLYYVLVITIAHMIKGAHQYAYPNTITTFTPTIALILMSKEVRKSMRLCFCRPRVGSNIVAS
ncbi:hypothetical protein PENTCL1PPCAC_2765, partial [Pristionchus entomophagus]